jgi:hypothetical protein
MIIIGSEGGIESHACATEQGFTPHCGQIVTVFPSTYSNYGSY